MTGWKLALCFSAAVVAAIGGTLLLDRRHDKESSARLDALEAKVHPGSPRRAYTAEELGEMYKSRFAAEARDPAWADEAERQIRPILDAQLPPTSRFVSLECRSQFCRLEAVHETINTSNDFVMHLFAMQFGMPLHDVAGGFRAAPPVPTPDGKLDYVVYIARPGARLALDVSDGGA
jgi:hypothetical protein